MELAEYAEKSTTDRLLYQDVAPTRQKQAAPPPALRALRTGVRALRWVSPELAVWAANRVWFTPPRAPLRDDARAKLARGERLPLRSGGRELAAWSFGSGDAVLLMHGWGGHAGQLVPWIEPLVEAGRRVLLFDGPGHGQSPASALGYRQGSFVEIAEAMRALEALAGPLGGVVAHSGGAIATGVAMTLGLSPARLVLLSPMTRPQRYAGRYLGWLGLDGDEARAFYARAERQAGFRWEDLDLTTAAARHTTPRLLVQHDQGDPEVPVDDGRVVAAAWPGAELALTSGLGHYRILKDAAVIRRGVDFLTR